MVATGSSFVFPLVSKWIPEVDKALGTGLTYSPTGSGAGIAGVTARTVDWGGSDAPLTPSQLTACNGCVQIPIALSALSVPYNLPGIGNCVLRLTPQTLSAIYLGEITNWNDSRIKADNGKCNAARLEDHPGLPLGQLWVDLGLHQLPVGGQPRVEEQGRRLRPASTGRQVSARAAPRACRASSPRRRAR